MGLVLLFNPVGGAGAPVVAGPSTNLFFLFNEAGRAASSISILAGATATGYDATNVISGPRSTMWRSESNTNAEIAYLYGSNIGISYVVIARADLLASKAGKHIVGQQRSSGGSWSDIPGFSYNITDTSLMVGPRTQDMVIATTPTDLRGIALFSQALSGSEAMQISKFYAGGAFAFGVPPQANIEYAEIAPKNYATTIQGTMPYEVERSFSMTFVGVTQAEYAQFLLYDSFYAPFFLYDSTGDIWPWKLEHVILGSLTATMLEYELYALTMNFFRLRTYGY